MAPEIVRPLNWSYDGKTVRLYDGRSGLLGTLASTDVARALLALVERGDDATPAPASTAPETPIERAKRERGYNDLTGEELLRSHQAATEKLARPGLAPHSLASEAPTALVQPAPDEGAVLALRDLIFEAATGAGFGITWNAAHMAAHTAIAWADRRYGGKEGAR